MRGKFEKIDDDFEFTNVYLKEQNVNVYLPKQLKQSLNQNINCDDFSLNPLRQPEDLYCRIFMNYKEGM